MFPPVPSLAVTSFEDIWGVCRLTKFLHRSIHFIKSPLLLSMINCRVILNINFMRISFSHLSMSPKQLHHQPFGTLGENWCEILSKLTPQVFAAKRWSLSSHGYLSRKRLRQTISEVNEIKICEGWFNLRKDHGLQTWVLSVDSTQLRLNCCTQITQGLPSLGSGMLPSRLPWGLVGKLRESLDLNYNPRPDLLPHLAANSENSKSHAHKAWCLKCT